MYGPGEPVPVENQIRTYWWCVVRRERVSVKCVQQPERQCHVWTYMDPARLQPILASSGPRVTTADVYPASLCGVIEHRREPRWIFARFRLNGAKALAEAMPVQTPGSGSDGVTVSPSSANRLQL